MSSLRIGTRGSALARVQAEHVAELLRAEDPALEVSIVVSVTSGDRGVAGAQDGALVDGAAGVADDKSRWVDTIEAALVDGEVDVAVHSAKDVPGQLAPGLVLAGAPAREDARDALCGAPGLDDLREGAVVGSSSLRRAAQLRALRPDLDVVPLHGNVDTRLRRLDQGRFDAIVLAMAGLRRLGRADAVGAALDASVLVPAAGQGTLALEVREDDEQALRAAAAITDAGALAQLEAERAVVRSLEATCRTPVGAYARLVDDAGGRGPLLDLHVFVGLPDGSAWVRDHLTGSPDRAAALGEAAAERVMAAGARDLLEQAEAMAGAGA